MWQPVLMISGYILGILGLIMLIPAGLDMFGQGVDWSPFLSSAMIVIFFGFALFLSNYTKIENITLKQGYLITAVSWISVCLFSAIPFWFHHSVDTRIDAVFEAVSGITGTGATIMSDVESLPHSILFWRSLLNYIGGLGIVIFAVALLPFLGIGGMQIFQHENSDSNDKFMPKFSYIAKRIVVVYLVLTAISAGTLFLCGMNGFDAVNHAMSAIGTGGFSTKNNSIGFYNSVPIEFFTMLFMLMGALPMTFYILLYRRSNPDRNKQVRVFLKMVAAYALCLGGYLYFSSDYSLWYVIRYSLFTVIAVVTTTGLSSCDYTEWGVWVAAAILFLSLTGGCTGSTAGSIKIFRWQVIYAFLRKYLLSAIEPNRVILMKIGAVNMPEKATMSVFVYVFSFIISLIGMTLLVSACGLDLRTALSAVTACITNVGVGAISAIGPSGNYAFFSDTVKSILCFTMLLGRLEIITILVVFTKSFWHK
ncbi:MAG: TrkH family potassium uptake protein [Alphaproteobacteria bacterium]|nr:TrkH family potassium uptake protein [Alphaproteobacteria bacterium]